MLPLATVLLASTAHLVVRKDDAADSCPDAATLAANTSDAMGRAALAVDGTGPTYEVEFARADDAFVARLHTPSGDRLLSDVGPTCAALAEAAILSLSLLLEEKSAEPPPREAPIAPSPPREAPAEAPPPQPRVVRWRGVELDVGAGVAAGVVRSAAPLVTAAARWVAPIRALPALSLGVGAMAIPTQSLALGTGTVDVSFAAATADVCVEALRTSGGLHAEGCAMPIFGVVRASGHGYASSSTAAPAWLGGALAVAAGGPLIGPIGWRARIGALFPLHPRALGVDGAGVAYDPPVVSTLTDAALTVTIP